MKKSSVMVVLGLALALTACQGGGKAPESGASQANEAAKEDLAAQGGEAKGEEAKGEEPGDDGAKAAASGETVTLKLSNNQPDGNCTTVAVEWFADQVRERTDGRVNIEVYNNGTLGDAISCLEQAQFGGMDIVKADLSTMTNFVDDYNALMMPYIYKDTEHFWKVHGGDVGMGILRGDKMKEKKLYGLTYYDGGTRCFYNTKKEIHSPEDMKGMLVRVQESELMMSMVERLGGQSVATAYSEVYSALQTGVVDAAENSIVNYLDQSHFEVAPYFVEDHHTRSADILVMGEKSREKLSEEDLKIIDETALESWEYQKELWAEAEEESKKKLLENPVTITELTPEELELFQEACKPIWYEYEGGAYKDLIDQIVAAGE